MVDLSKAWNDYQKGLLLLKQDQLIEGLNLFDRRLDLWPDNLRSRFKQPGSMQEVQDQHVCIVADPDIFVTINGEKKRVASGLGYELLFSFTLLEILEQKPRQLTVIADKRLEELFKRSFSDITFIGREENLELILQQIPAEAEIVAPLLSLVQYSVQLKDGSFTLPDPWLKGYPNSVSQYEKIIRQWCGGNIPLLIACGASSADKRSIPLKDFISFLGQLPEHFTFINMQSFCPGNEQADIMRASLHGSLPNHQIIHPPFNVRQDIDMLTAWCEAIRNLKGVAVTIPNSEACLMHALGVKVHLLDRKDRVGLEPSFIGQNVWEYKLIEPDNNWSTALTNVKTVLQTLAL